MKLEDIFKENDGYVVALVKERDTDGVPKDIEPKMCCKTFAEADRKRKSLSGMDVVICPPFRHGEISPAETADYFRAYYGTNSDLKQIMFKYYITL